MQMQDIARAYQTKTDEELLELATESEQLTAEAHSVLLSELARRRIDNPRPLDVQDPSGFGEVQDPEKSEVPRQSDPGAIGEFMAEVLRIYYDRLWLFAKLAAPGVVVGYVALVLGRDEGREIASHLPRGIAILSHQPEFLEIWLANTAGYLVSWMASCFSFGVICSAVRQIAAGVIPSASDCFVEVRQRMGSFVRFSAAFRFASCSGGGGYSLVVSHLLDVASGSHSLWNLGFLGRLVWNHWLSAASPLTLWFSSTGSRPRRLQCLQGNVPQ
jgi:hypothetical protein